MRMVKVYNKDGVLVDRFRKPSESRRSFSSGNFNQMVKHLNSNGYYIRRQFSTSGKSLQLPEKLKPFSAKVKSVVSAVNNIINSR